MILICLKEELNSKIMSRNLLVRNNCNSIDKTKMAISVKCFCCDLKKRKEFTEQKFLIRPNHNIQAKETYLKVLKKLCN
ncbi:hypothetical protein HW555_009805 [Spodoptera exigua]|uniref:Uncharacterized protein n=1 Tax=Spodoptera exigua TaxID=7107 RepID=A0A835L0F7_SPOEX|nr:hypothetical protein HW555_009805 [Spodoptera exigua]